VRVVEDTPDMVALFTAGDTRWKVWRNLNGEVVTPRDVRDGTWVMEDLTWNGLGTLSLTIPGSLFSVWLFWQPGYRGLRCWYVNLEEPIYRVGCGFEFKDMVLDMVVSPDGTEFRWKDEAEFAEMIELGLISREKADLLRETGVKALELLRSGESPFERWRDWVPPAEWRGISLSLGWDIA